MERMHVNTYPTDIRDNRGNTIPMAEPSRENLRQIGREALASQFRGAALKCVLKFQLTSADIESVAGDIMREVDAYMSQNDAA